MQTIREIATAYWKEQRRKKALDYCNNLEDIEDAYIAGFEKCLNEISEIVLKKIDTYPEKIAKAAKHEDHRMWSYFIGAKDTLLELIDNLKEKNQ